MKPEEYLMQHYRYWTIPDLGLSEDERGYVEALRIGAEAIKEVERLRAENKQLSDQGFKAMTAQGVSLQLLAELESERKCLLDTGLFDNISELFHAWNELDDENEELKQRIEELTKTLADEAEHNDTAPHEGCSCQRCMMIRRIAELEAFIAHWNIVYPHIGFPNSNGEVVKMTITDLPPKETES